MAFLNKQQRDALQDELKQLNFNRAKAKLRHLDSKGRLVYYRNVQAVDKWATRYELPGLGTRVTLIEAQQYQEQDGSKNLKSEYEMIDVVVEPTPGNKT